MAHLMDRMGYDAFWMASTTDSTQATSAFATSSWTLSISSTSRPGCASARFNITPSGIPSGIPATHNPLEIDFVRL